MKKFILKTFLIAVISISTASLAVHAYVPGGNPDNPSKNPNFVGDLYVLVKVSYFANYNPPGATKFADMSDKVFVGSNQNPEGQGQVLIKLTQGGNPIVDPYPANNSYHDVPGIHLVRGVDSEGKPFVDFVTYGFNHNKSRESVKFTASFLKSRESVKLTAAFLSPSALTSVVKLDYKNGGVGIGKYEKYNNGSCGIFENPEQNAKFDKDGDDEFKIASYNQARFCSVTSGRLDGMRVFYGPDGDILSL